VSPFWGRLLATGTGWASAALMMQGDMFNPLCCFWGGEGDCFSAFRRKVENYGFAAFTGMALWFRRNGCGRIFGDGCRM